MNFGVGDFFRFAVADWRLRRWRLCFLALMTATRLNSELWNAEGQITIFMVGAEWCSLSRKNNPCFG